MNDSGLHVDGIDAAAETSSRRRWLTWAVVFGFWTLFAFIYASQIYLGTRAEGMTHSYWRMLAWQLSGWYVWGLFTPLILRLGRRFPVGRSSWARAVIVHLPACAILSAVHLAFFTFVTGEIRPFDEMSDTRPFLDRYLSRLTSQLHLDLLIYAAILGVGDAFAYYDKYRERESRAAQLEAQLAQAQLQALKMQLHPHFLFNTLNAVSALVRENANRAAVQMIAGLSDLLRHSLEGAGRQEVTLREELEFLERYLDIQQMRFSDRLEVRMEIAPETLDARVPNLILQPLVENAIHHGVAPRAAAGTVGVSAARENGRLRINVYDDGPGLAEGWRMEQGGGIGLANTRARLRQLYGTDHRFDVSNREGGGVEAALAIPWRVGGAETNHDGEREEKDQDADRR
ncbi:MAG: sensor histidine kinase [Pyrinomonadaceae bacterium]